MPAKRFDINDAVLDRCVGICFVQKKFIRSSLKETLYQMQLYPDFNQEFATAAVEAWRN
jgi:hypothetical protein